MPHFDAEKKRAAAMVAKYNAVAAKAKEVSTASTATLRSFIDKVSKNEAALAQIAKAGVQRVGFIDGVERSIATLEGLLKKAETLSEAEAAEVLAKKTWGNLVVYAFNKSAPAKPQLATGVKDGIEKEMARGRKILDDLQKAHADFEKAGQKHFAACEAAKKFGTVTVID